MKLLTSFFFIGHSCGVLDVPFLCLNKRFYIAYFCFDIFSYLIACRLYFVDQLIVKKTNYMK